MRCTPATEAQYRLAIDRHIVPALGGMPIAAVGRAHVAALQHSLADRPATANQAIATLSRLKARYSEEFRIRSLPKEQQQM